IPVCMYHGSPAERAELRRTAMALPSERKPPKKKAKTKGRLLKSKGKSKTPAKRGGRSEDVAMDEDEDEDEDEGEPVDPMASFPIVITTYEMIIKDRAHLEHYNWGYIVVDEGHRLKNLNCRLIKEIKRYKSAGRMILTGTPLH
ncbi:hypothetical protein H0H93_002041, partial [Arthromyces matolae]